MFFLAAQRVLAVTYGPNAMRRCGARIREISTDTPAPSLPDRIPAHRSSRETSPTQGSFKDAHATQLGMSGSPFRDG